MPAGAPRKPTVLRKLGGNAGHRAMSQNEPQPGPLDTKWPDWAGLSPRAKQHWPRIANRLVRDKVAADSDLENLVMLVEAYAEWLECSLIVQKLGRTYSSPTATGEITRPRPEVAMRDIAQRTFERLSGQFGMTPSTRSRVEAVSDPDTIDPFEELTTRRPRG